MGEQKPQKWTGYLIGKMHNENVTYDDLAKELHCSKSYVSMILNGQRSPDGARRRLYSAFEKVVARRQQE